MKMSVPLWARAITWVIVAHVFLFLRIMVQYLTRPAEAWLFFLLIYYRLPSWDLSASPLPANIPRGFSPRIRIAWGDPRHQILYPVLCPVGSCRLLWEKK